MGHENLGLPITVHKYKNLSTSRNFQVQRIAGFMASCQSSTFVVVIDVDADRQIGATSFARQALRRPRRRRRFVVDKKAKDANVGEQKDPEEKFFEKIWCVWRSCQRPKRNFQSKMSFLYENFSFIWGGKVAQRLCFWPGSILGVPKFYSLN